MSGRRRAIDSVTPTWRRGLELELEGAPIEL
jgi:hypothetical protein